MAANFQALDGNSHFYHLRSRQPSLGCIHKLKNEPSHVLYIFKYAFLKTAGNFSVTVATAAVFVNIQYIPQNKFNLLKGLEALGSFCCW